MTHSVAAPRADTLIFHRVSSFLAQPSVDPNQPGVSRLPPSPEYHLTTERGQEKPKLSPREGADGIEPEVHNTVVLGRLRTEDRFRGLAQFALPREILSQNSPNQTQINKDKQASSTVAG